MNYPKMIALTVLATAYAFATDGTYTANASKYWTDTTGWASGIVATGSGGIATINRSAFTTNRTVTIASDITLGGISFVGAAAAIWSNSINGAGIITLDNGSEAATLSTSAWGSSSIYNKLRLVSDLNIQAMPQNASGTAYGAFFGFYSSIYNADDSAVRTITTIKPTIAYSSANDFRVVFSGGVTGNVAIVHNSGTNLNIQAPSNYTGGIDNNYYGGLYIKSGLVNCSAWGTDALGASNNVIYFEAKDAESGTSDAVLGFSGTITVSSDMAVAEQNMVLNADGRISVGMTSTSSYKAITWTGQISGSGALIKQGADTLVLSNSANSYTGNTIIEAGILQLGASNSINSASKLVLKGGTFDANGLNNSFSALDLDANGVITLGSVGTNTLVFGDSSTLDWGSYTLTITGEFTDGESIRIGTDANGLTADQLAKITINGEVAYLTSTGYLTTTIPEPAVAALLTGALALALAARRRRA